MKRDYLQRAFAAERRERALGRRRYPGWLSVTQARPVGRPEPADSAWTDAAAIAWSIAGLLAVFALAGALKP